MANDEHKFMICAAIALTEIKRKSSDSNHLESDLSSESIDSASGNFIEYEYDDVDISIYTCHLAALLGVITFMHQDEAGHLAGMLPRLDSSSRSKFLKNIPGCHTAILVSTVLRFVKQQAVRMAETSNGRQMKAKQTAEDKEILVQHLQYGMAVVSQLAHLSENSQRSDVVARKTSDNFQNILTDFFRDLVNLVCSSSDSLDNEDSLDEEESQLNFRRKIINIIKDLTVNRYLRTLFLDVLLGCILQEKESLIAEDEEDQNFVLYLEYLAEAGVEQVQGLRNELFCEDGTVSTFKRKRICDKSTLGQLTFPSMTFVAMKRHERTTFRAKVGRWLEDLTSIADQLSLKHSDFCRLVFLMQGEIQLIVEKTADVA